MKNILILEPHIDDMELGMSVYLQQLMQSTEHFNLTLITMCGQGNTRKGQNPLRIKKREENLKSIENSLNCIKVNWIRIEKEDYGDTTCGISWSQEIKDAFAPDKDDIFELWYCAKDLHADHTRMNDAIRILTRKNKPHFNTSLEVEYFIENSRDYSESFHYNYKVSSCGTGGFAWQSCFFPGEDIIVEEQKDISIFGGQKVITDYFNIKKITGLI